MGDLCRSRAALGRGFSTSARVRCTLEPEQVPRWGADLKETVGGKLGWVPGVTILAGIFESKSVALCSLDLNVLRTLSILSSYMGRP